MLLKEECAWKDVEWKVGGGQQFVDKPSILGRRRGLKGVEEDVALPALLQVSARHYKNSIPTASIHNFNLLNI
jgi:hypothetical protein